MTGEKIKNILVDRASNEPVESAVSQNNGKAVVFIHGIFSSCEVFDNAFKKMSDNKDFASYSFYNYDYSFGRSLEHNAENLTKSLHHLKEMESVTIIAHSMGGLVARLALLREEKMPFVKLLFLLGTPNSGAITMRQLTIYLQLLHSTTNKISCMFPRVEGIANLTRVTEIIEDNLKQADNVSDVDYISISGMYFHENRNFFDGFLEKKKRWLKLLQTVVSVIGVYDARSKVNFSLPHDGLVESDSVNLNQANCRHEKEQSEDKSYAHLDLLACKDLVHTELHSDDTVINEMSNIIMAVDKLREESEVTDVICKPREPNLDMSRLERIAEKRSQVGQVRFEFCN